MVILKRNYLCTIYLKVCFISILNCSRGAEAQNDVCLNITDIFFMHLLMSIIQAIFINCDDIHKYDIKYINMHLTWNVTFEGSFRNC